MNLEKLHSMLLAGDQLLKAGQVDEGIQRIEVALRHFRQIEAAPEQLKYPASKDVPLSIRVLFLNREMAVALDRLADAYTAKGNLTYARALRLEEISRIDKAIANAGGETRAELERAHTIAVREEKELDRRIRSHARNTTRGLTDTEKKLLELAHRMKAGESPGELEQELIKDGMPQEHAEGMVGLAKRIVV